MEYEVVAVATNQTLPGHGDADGTQNEAVRVPFKLSTSRFFASSYSICWYKRLWPAGNTGDMYVCVYVRL